MEFHRFDSFRNYLLKLEELSYLLFIVFAQVSEVVRYGFVNPVSQAFFHDIMSVKFVESEENHRDKSVMTNIFK